MAAYDKCDYKKIDDFDANFLKIGLGHINGMIGKREISGRGKCISFLNQIVDYNWKNLKGELKKYNRTFLIIESLRNIEGIAAEKKRWDRTARAVLSLHENIENIHQSRIKHFSSLYAADLASRILIETAVCECPLTGGYEGGSFDLSPLMARTSLLFHLGNLSDAIMKGVINAKILISGNGDIKSEQEFHDEIITPFSQQYEKDKLADSVERYDNLFEDLPDPKSTSEIFPADFLFAFEKEFRVNLDIVVNFQEAMETLTIEKEKIILQIPQSQIITHCEKKEKINKKQVLNVLNAFCLMHRKNWEQVPADFKPKDIYPWLFRRRLSLLFKPFIKIDDSKDPTYILSTGISSDALAYTLGVYYKGYIEEDRCRSNEMKIWIGKERAHRGHEFNKKVEIVLHNLGYNARSDINVSSIISKKDLNKDYGDIDVLAWSDEEESIYIIECKDLFFAKTFKEIAEQLLEFRGRIRNGKPDRLKKHLDRVEILLKNKDLLLKFCGLSHREIKIITYVLFSNPVPMLYDNSIPKSVIFSSIQEIKRRRTLK